MRIVESSDVAISQRESGENAASNIRPLNPLSSLTTRRVSMSTSLMARSSQVTDKRPLSRCSSRAVTEESSCSCASCLVEWKSKNWHGQNAYT